MLKGNKPVGRPRKNAEDRADTYLTIRIYNHQKDMLDQLCDATGKSKTKVVLDALKLYQYAILMK